jgi:hypothetical protein
MSKLDDILERSGLSILEYGSQEDKGKYYIGFIGDTVLDHDTKRQIKDLMLETIELYGDNRNDILTKKIEEL